MEAHFYNVKGKVIMELTTDKVHPYVVVRSDDYTYGYSTEPNSHTLPSTSRIFKLRGVSNDSGKTIAEYDEQTRQLAGSPRV